MHVKLTRTETGSVLALPDTLLQEAHWEPNALLDLTLVDGKLWITPASERGETLEEMLSRVTPDNLHGETDCGLPVGREVL